MSQHFGDLEGVETDIDNIIIHADTEFKHDHRLDLVLDRCKKINLRAPVCKNQTNSKFRGKGGKFDFFHILMSDRLGYN